MCGRMTLTRSGSEIAEYFAEAMQALVLQSEQGEAAHSGIVELNGQPLRPRFNLSPSQDALTVVSGPMGSGVAAEFAWKRWGLVPSWAEDLRVGSRLFNARAETADVKPSFRAAFKRRRCLVVVDGFYEWTPKNRDHQPFHFQSSDGALMALAGLHEGWRGEGGEVVESCTVLTTDANEDLAGVHHRMPVILAAQDYGMWLDPDSDLEIVKRLAVSTPNGFLTRKEVGRRVNDPRADDASCLEPEGAPERGDTDEGATPEPQGELFARPAAVKPPRNLED